MYYKEILSAAAMALTLLVFIPYFFAIASSKAKPHVLSWVIWGITTCIVFLAQLEDQGGVGAWPIGLSGVVTLLIALLAWTKHADISITKVDWLFFITALSSLPLWYWMSDPLWAVVILTTIDFLGFGPTFRKIYHYPYSESLVFYLLFAIRNVMVVIALENYSVTTVLFPVVVGAACMALVGIAIYRRRALSI